MFRGRTKTNVVQICYILGKLKISVLYSVQLLSWWMCLPWEVSPLLFCKWAFTGGSSVNALVGFIPNPWIKLPWLKTLTGWGLIVPLDLGCCSHDYIVSKPLTIDYRNIKHKSPSSVYLSCLNNHHWCYELNGNLEKIVFVMQTLSLVTNCQTCIGIAEIVVDPVWCRETCYPIEYIL